VLQDKCSLWLHAVSFVTSHLPVVPTPPAAQDALSDRDLVHRQTAAAVVQHMSMGVPGLGCEDALLHLLNYVWPNVFEDSPHLINGVMGAIDGCRLSLGPCVVLHYTLQVGARVQLGGRGCCCWQLSLVTKVWFRFSCTICC
jgi:hypothetical protein